MIDALFLMSLNVVSQVFPALLVDLLKRLTRKDTQVFRTR